MSPAAFRQPRSRAAIACSIAVHCCLLGLLALTWTPPTLFQLRDVVEQTPPLPIRLEIRPRRPEPPPRTVAARPVAPVVHRETHVIKVFARLAALVQNAPVRVSAPRSQAPDPDHIARQTAPTSVNARTAVIALATAPAALAPTPSPTTAPTTAPTTTPSNAPVGHGDGGLFGQNYPALPNPPDAFAAIRARIVGHFRIRVHVDETGHATAVLFLTPLADPALADEVRTSLLAITYVPADCNGLRCSDDVDIVR